jgi:flagellin-like hook-associated protein FlgL
MSGITYSVSVNDVLKISVNAPNVYVDGVVIGPVKKELSYQLTANVKPLEILTYLQGQFANIVIFPNGKTLDEAVQATMGMISAVGAGGGIDNDIIKRNKAFAKYYYKMFANNDVQAIKNNVDTKYQEAVLIVVGLFSWWYIRRLVHIFVVFATLEGVSAPASSSTTPIVISTTTSTDNIDSLKQTVKDLSTMLAEKTSTINTMTTELAKLDTVQSALDNVKVVLQNKDTRIADLEQQLMNFKELLLHSTSMIFRIEEVPNLINAS